MNFYNNISEGGNSNKKKCIIFSAVIVVVLLFLVFIGTKIFSSDSGPQFPPVPEMKSWDHQVDLDKVLGVKWYQIAESYGFEDIDSCSNNVTITIEAGLLNVKMENKFKSNPYMTSKRAYSCSFDHLDTQNTKLRLRPASSLWSKWSYIYIIDGSLDYAHLLIVEPNSKMFSILSKTPTLDQKIINKYVQKLTSLNFSTFGVQFDQTCARES